MADGTVIEYFPYFECDGWGNIEAARNRLVADSTYPLAVLGWAQPIASLTTSSPTITHTVILARAGFGPPDPTSDARLVTTLAFDGGALREIAGS